MGRRKQDGAGFLTKKAKTRLNSPPLTQPWVWISYEMLESGAFRSLSIHARRALDRIMLEHMQHGGQDNGRLKVTWNDFVKFGTGRKFVKFAIGELVAVGLIAIEQPGRRAWGQDKGEPTQYRLTYLPVSEPNNFHPATNEWMKFETDIRAARSAIKAKQRKTHHKFNGQVASMAFAAIKFFPLVTHGDWVLVTHGDLVSGHPWCTRAGHPWCTTYNIFPHPCAITAQTPKHAARAPGSLCCSSLHLEIYRSS